MSLRWAAEGIEAAERAGGITLEVYHRPGFMGTKAVRRHPEPIRAVSYEPVPDPDPYEDDE